MSPAGEKLAPADLLSNQPCHETTVGFVLNDKFVCRRLKRTNSIPFHDALSPGDAEDESAKNPQIGTEASMPC